MIDNMVTDKVSTWCIFSHIFFLILSFKQNTTYSLIHDQKSFVQDLYVEFFLFSNTIWATLAWRTCLSCREPLFVLDYQICIETCSLFRFWDIINLNAKFSVNRYTSKVLYPPPMQVRIINSSKVPKISEQSPRLLISQLWNLRISSGYPQNISDFD